MKAAVIKAPNSEVQIEERDCPSRRRGQVLIRVHACGVCHGDLIVQQDSSRLHITPLCQGMK